MERLAAISLILASCSPLKAKTCRLGDVVRFKFSERNLFYSDICNDYGEVTDRTTYSDGTKYLVWVKCANNNTIGEGIWVDAEDIVAVLKLGKDVYK